MAEHEFGPFRLDDARRTLERDGRLIPLYPKSFDLLAFMVRQTGHLLEKEHLLRALWPDVVVEENSLARAVSDIRKALAEHEGFVVTVPRRGYRFDCPVRPCESMGKAPRSATRTIAVLPFRPLSDDEADQQLAFGIADSLVARLSTIHQFSVRPPSSVLKYANDQQTPAAAGGELGVDVVLSGTLRKAGTRLRVNAQLIDVRTDTALWADTFDENAADVFTVEDSIAGRVASALAPQLSAREREHLARRHTTSPEAYDAFLGGRYFWSRRTGGSLRTAAEYFKRAIALDDRFARAHAGLAEAYIALSVQHVTAHSLPPREVIPPAREAALKALSIDPLLPEAHAALAHIALSYDWNWPLAEQGYLRALELDPDCANAHHWYAIALSCRGRFEEALAEIRETRRLDPLSIIASANLGFTYYRARRYAEAVSALQATVSLDPAFHVAHYRLGLALQALGRFDEALAEFDEAIRLSDADPAALAGKAHLLAETGKGVEARALIERLERLSTERYVSALLIAEIFVPLNDDASAFAWLEKALEERPTFLMSLRNNYKWDRLRGDARFVDIERRVGIWSPTPR
jgi:TolB-like protein/tetratricopeptide (TPR) repeat protein